MKHHLFTLLLGCNGFLPPNDLSIPPSHKSEGLDQKQYEAVINKVDKVYRPVVNEHGAILRIDKLWNSPVVNAGALRDNGGKHWHVKLYGGLARHKYMTEDAYAMVICHELGHHMGGAPKKIIEGSKIWSSTEGQSDYWATLKCLRRLFVNDDNPTIMASQTVPTEVTLACEEQYNLKNNIALCKRVALATQALTKISAEVRRVGYPEFGTPDQTVVLDTFEKHPLPQCRMDSFFQGALCSISWKNPVSQTDSLVGTCHPKKGHETGNRPLCWFKP